MSKRKEVKISEEEILRQQIFINEVRRENEEFFKKNGRRKKHLTVTWGCAKVNVN